MTAPVTQTTVAALLKQAGFAERILPSRGRRAPAAADGFQVFDHKGGGVFVCWIPVAGQDSGNLDAFGRSYDMAREYAAAARDAGGG